MNAYTLKQILSSNVPLDSDEEWLLITNVNEIRDNIKSVNKLISSLSGAYLLAVQGETLFLARVPQRRNIFHTDGSKIKVNVESYSELPFEIARYYRGSFKLDSYAKIEIVIGNREAIVGLYDENSTLLESLEKEKFKPLPMIRNPLKSEITLDKRLGLDSSEAPYESKS